ncbi:MAG: phosphatase [Lachnospiraceae bacterium]|nr:phosphatase [Lachnospiraceae bacterium]
MSIYFMDLHTHTIASGHAYSTLQENIAAAREKGLQFLGLSEHGPAVAGGPDRLYFLNYKIIPRQYGELKLYCGAEANITDYEGHLDLDNFVLERLDYCIASMHTMIVTPGSARENTMASIHAMENPYVKILGHPDDSRYPLDYEELVRAAAKLQVALEVNNSSLHPLSARQGANENQWILLQYCMRFGVSVILGTDSHFSSAVGDFTQADQLLKELDFPQELVINRDPGRIGEVVNRRS